METSRKKVLIWVSVAAGLLAVGWTGVNLYYRHNFGQGYLAIREVIRFYDNALPALRASPPYDTLNSGEQGIRFTYQAADAPELVNLRVHLNLDSIAGNGDDISKIKNILRWAHRAIPHNGFRMPECELTSMGLYRYATEEGEGISCKHTSRLLSDCFLSIGFSSRAVTCSSMLEKDPDCHVVNAVWSPSRSKWVYVDASFGAYYTDLNGEMLSFSEIRSNYIEGREMLLVMDEYQNSVSEFGDGYYFDTYMPKGFYWFMCPADSRYYDESADDSVDLKYNALVPMGFEPYRKAEYVTNNDRYFWQGPE